MELKSKIIMGLAALLLGALFVMPFWSISMKAPQYPEGIGMYIHINDISGHNKHDIQSINTLNHYIGMKELHKEDFPEFVFMPWIIGFMVAFGVIAAISGKVNLVVTWFMLMLLLSVVGLVDYYLWGYDYGHNLNPDAPIKIPGMSYQPPMIGSKQLLNINASSWPTWGALFPALSLAMATGVIWYEKFSKRGELK